MSRRIGSKAIVASRRRQRPSSPTWEPLEERVLLHAWQTIAINQSPSGSTQTIIEEQYLIPQYSADHYNGTAYPVFGFFNRDWPYTDFAYRAFYLFAFPFPYRVPSLTRPPSR